MYGRLGGCYELVVGRGAVWCRQRLARVRDTDNSSPDNWHTAGKDRPVWGRW